MCNNTILQFVFYKDSFKCLPYLFLMKVLKACPEFSILKVLQNQFFLGCYSCMNKCFFDSLSNWKIKTISIWVDCNISLTWKSIYFMHFMHTYFRIRRIIILLFFAVVIVTYRQFLKDNCFEMRNWNVLRRKCKNETFSCFVNYFSPVFNNTLSHFLYLISTFGQPKTI